METNAPIGTVSVESGAVGRRIVAGLIDLALAFAVLLVFAHFFGTTTNYQTSATTSYGAGQTATSTGGGVAFNLSDGSGLVYLLVVLAYYVGMECMFGATLGKQLLGLRVVSAHGGPISLGQALGRNLLRVIDGFPYIVPNLIGLVVVASSSKRQRIGDMAVGTLVVRRTP